MSDLYRIDQSATYRREDMGGVTSFSGFLVKVEPDYEAAREVWNKQTFIDIRAVVDAALEGTDDE